MRVSVNKDDPGYANFRGFGVHFVYLNGALHQRVITADEELGEIVTPARDYSGKLVIVTGKDGESELKTETLHGNVTIKNVTARDLVSQCESNRPIKIAVDPGSV